jgi:hypothetical protein
MGHPDRSYRLYLSAPDEGYAIGMAGRRRGGLGDWLRKSRSSKPHSLPKGLYEPKNPDSSANPKAARMQTPPMIKRFLRWLGDKRALLAEYGPHGQGVVFRPVDGSGLTRVPVADVAGPGRLLVAYCRQALQVGP